MVSSISSSQQEDVVQPDNSAQHQAETVLLAEGRLGTNTGTNTDSGSGIESPKENDEEKRDDQSQQQEQPSAIPYFRTLSPNFPSFQIDMSPLEQLKVIAEEMVSIPINFILGKAEKPRRWLSDRCDGTSEYQDGSRPPCAIFYVPMPVRWFPDVLEQNPLCERFGRVGCTRPYDYGLRKIVFGVATLCQLIAFCLTFYSAFAISKDYDIVQATAFSRGSARVLGGEEFGFAGERVTFDLGLLGVALDGRVSGEDGRVMKWKEFCGFYSDGFLGVNAPGIYRESCESCGKRSRSLVASMIMSLLFSIPSFTTNILRFYPDYDVNCQKFFGSVVSFISMCSSLVTWYGYYQGCVQAFFSQEIGVYANMTRASSVEEGDMILDFHWEAGWGYTFVVIATVLKIADVICNLAVPTPEICRDHAEQAMYEIVALNRDIKDEDVAKYTPETVAMLRQSVILAKKDYISASRRNLMMQHDPSGAFSSHFLSQQPMDTLNEEESLQFGLPSLRETVKESDQEEEDDVNDDEEYASSATPPTPRRTALLNQPIPPPPPSVSGQQPLHHDHHHALAGMPSKPSPRSPLHKSVYF